MTPGPGPSATRTRPAPPVTGRRLSAAAGIGAGITAGLVWGLAFLMPVLLGGWNPVIVTIGRYLAYGLVSAALFTLGGQGMRALAHQHWRPALAFAIAGNAGYYLLLVTALRAAG